MQFTNRKSFARFSFAAKAAFLVGCAVLLTGSAGAQSYAGSNASISYSFGLDPNSAGLGSYLSVQDQGESVFNMVESSAGPFTNKFGATSVVDAIVSSATIFSGYDATTMTWSGYNGIVSDAYETTVPGGAISSIGSKETLLISNTGTAPITLDVSALAFCFGSATVSGTVSSFNTASSYTFTNIGDYDYGTGTTSSPVIFDQDFFGFTPWIGYSSEWTPLPPSVYGPGAYSGIYTTTIAAGDMHALEFYVDSEDTAIDGILPNTPGLTTLGIGLLGLILKRKRKAQPQRFVCP